MLNALETRLRRLFSTPGGRSVLEALEREATATEGALDRRRAAASRIEEARRRDREETPGLREAVDQAEAALNVAREAFERAQGTRYETGMALFRHGARVRDDIRGAEAELRRTADPRLAEALALVTSEEGQFHHTARRLLRLEMRGVGMAAYHAALNQDEVDGLERRLASAHAALERLMQVPAPGEEEVLAAVKEAHAAVEAVSLPDGGGR